MPPINVPVRPRLPLRNKCCRLCLTADPDAGLTNLFVSVSPDNDRYAKRIDFTFGLKAASNDVFPKFICGKCIAKVDAAHSTKKLALRAEELIQKVHDKETALILASMKKKEPVKAVVEPVKVEVIIVPEPEIIIEEKVVPPSRWPEPKYDRAYNLDKNYTVEDFIYEIRNHEKKMAVLLEMRAYHIVRRRKVFMAQLKDYCAYRIAQEVEEAVQPSVATPAFVLEQKITSSILVRSRYYLKPRQGNNKYPRGIVDAPRSIPLDQRVPKNQTQVVKKDKKILKNLAKKKSKQKLIILIHHQMSYDYPR